MPLELRIRHGTTFADDTGAGIERDELERALVASGAPFERAVGDEDAWWVRYSEALSAKSAGELWFSASWRAPGFVSLRCSYSNCRIARNAIDLLYQALRLAKPLRATVFTESSEVTEENVTTFHKPTDAAWIQAAVLKWRDTLASLDDEPQGAIEVPLDDRDLVPEYAFFHVMPGRRVDIDHLSEVLTSRAHFDVKVAPPGLYIMNGERFAAQVVAREDGLWQIRIGHGRTPWPIAARAALTCARTIRGLSGGDIKLVGVLLDEALERELEARTAGSGVEFYSWFHAEHPTARLVRAGPGGKPRAGGTAEESPPDFLERNIASAVSLMERETGTACGFNDASVRWLEGHMKRLRGTDDANRAKQLPILGSFFGQCMVVTFRGVWARLEGEASGLAVQVRPNVFIVPWTKVEGFLKGDDGDSVVGFFRAIEKNYLTDDRAEPAVIS